MIVNSDTNERLHHTGFGSSAAAKEFDRRVRTLARSVGRTRAALMGVLHEDARDLAATTDRGASR